MCQLIVFFIAVLVVGSKTTEIKNRGLRINVTNSWIECFWPYTGTYCEKKHIRPLRTAFLALLNGDPYVSEGVPFIQALNRHFADTMPSSDIVLFVSEESLKLPSFTAVQEEARSSILPVLFYPVALEYPEKWREIFQRNRPTGKNCVNRDWGVNFLHSMRFYNHLMFRSVHLMKYDYVLRLDTHLYPTDPIKCDLFDTMIRAKAVFGFYSWGNGTGCTGNITEEAHLYARTNGWNPLHPVTVTSYGGAFGLFKWSFWTHPEVLKWSDYADNLALEYFWRLGEQQYYPPTISIFVPLDYVHQFGGIDWLHRGVRIWEPGKVNRGYACSVDKYCSNLTLVKSLSDPVFDSSEHCTT